MKITNYLVIAVLFVLAGCSTKKILVQDVAENPEKFLQENFSVGVLSKSVRAKIDRDSNSSIKRIVRLDKVRKDLTDGVEKETKVEETHEVLNNGLVRIKTQVSKNEIPTLLEFSLNYYGVVDFKYQIMGYKSEYLTPAYYIKKVETFDFKIENPEENKEYSFEYAKVPEYQIANFKTRKASCKSGEWLDAKDINSKLTGRVLPFECQHFLTNGQMFSKVNHYYIEDFGISTRYSSSTTNKKNKWDIVDIKVLN